MAQMDNIQKLPGDINTKFAIILEMYNDLVDKYNKLDGEVSWYKRQMHGTKSERMLIDDSLQMKMTELLEQVPESEDFEIKEETKEVKIKTKKPKKQGHGRPKLPDHLHREKEIIDIDDSLKQKYGEENLQKIEEVVSEYLEIRREMFVKQLIRIKYVLKDKTGSERFIIPELPSRPIDKCLAGTSVLAHVLVSKYVDHMPLYRLAKKFKREKIPICETTMSGWLTKLYQLLLPVYLSMIETLKEGDIINTDDTRMPVLVSGLRHKTHKGYIWVYTGNGVVIYDYRKTRGKEGPLEFLKGWNGEYIQADACPSYDLSIETYHLVEVGCWAHARRKFHESIESEPIVARSIVLSINKLYDIERFCKDKKFNVDKIKDYRMEHAPEILDEIKTQIDEIKVRPIPVLPESPLGKAVTYATNQWKALNTYIEDGRLTIDNNVSERFMKDVVIGRKNYLFAGSHEAAKRSALFYSIMGTCKTLDINPVEYLVDVLNKLPDYKLSQIKDLTPAEWLRSKDAGKIASPK